MLSPITYHHLDVDWTAPSNTLVRDGLSDDISHFTDFNHISANWNKAMDENSAIQFYEYCIGTSSGASDIQDWTNNGLDTNFTASLVNLTEGTNYFVSVRSTNNAGLLSGVSTSDGQELQATGVEDVKSSMDFVFYPNPVKELMQVEILNSKIQNTTAFIRDIPGKLIMQIPIKRSKITIDLSGLEKGLYIFQISGFTKIFVKE